MEEKLSLVFKAFGQPIQREILDILKDSHKTTGELNECFPHITRYAIMKHLNILEEANLVDMKKRVKQLEDDSYIELGVIFLKFHG